MREPCYKCKFEHKPITAEPCDHCSDVYIKTGDHPAFQYAKPITNYDCIIRKTPEELADWISNVPYREGDVCPPTHKCSLDMSCEKCWLAWLQKEASE